MGSGSPGLFLAARTNQHLKNLMVKAFGEVMGCCNMHKVSSRVAAQMLAIQRVADAIIIRGIYP